MSARKWKPGVLVAIAALTGVLSLSSGQADASLGEFSLSGTLGGNGGVESIAIDESTGDVYIYAPGSIKKVDAEGNPVNFSALGSNVININAGGGGEMQLAVDNSSGPAKGDIYVASGNVRIFGSDGKALGELTPVPGRPWGEVACGVAIDNTGTVFVGLYEPGSDSHVNEYVPAGNPVTNNDYTVSHGGLNEICNMSVDPEGGVYLSTWTFNRKGPIAKYNSQFGGAKLIKGEAGGTLAVANSPGAELFTVGLPSELEQYDAAGNLLNTFGTTGAGYHAVAINAKTGKLYAADSQHGDVEIWQGVVIPEVHTGQATSSSPVGSATLNGSVNPEEVSVEGCAFQYGGSVAYGSEANCAQTTPFTGHSVLPVSADVTGITPNQAYHYRLVATTAHGTIYGADQTFTILVLPTVEDVAPSVTEITRASVKFTGTVNPQHADTRYQFEYGVTEGYGNTTAFVDVGSGAGDVSVSQQQGELLPDTTYHYRLLASNLAGTTVSSDHTFTTGVATPPTASTGGSSGVAENSATIAGTVDTNGLPTTYGFEIGTSTDYGPPTGLGTVGAGGVGVPVSLTLAGLLPGTTYHYRLTATSIDGTSYGADQTFTTGVFASTFAEPPAPLPFVTVPVVAFPSEPKSIVVKKKAKAKGKKAKKHGKAKHKKKSKNKKK